MKIKNVKMTLLIFAGLIIVSFGVFAMAQENQSSNKNIFLDSDQDGLSDSEEKTYGTDPQNPDTDGDGYTDGAEVRSGYDPLKPAPGDKLITGDQTVTNVSASSASSQPTTGNEQQTVSDKQKEAGSNQNVNNDQQPTTTNVDEKNLTQNVSEKLAGLINSSMADGKEISLDDIDALLQQSTSSTLTFADLPTIDEKSIKIKKQNYSKLSEAAKTAKEKEDMLGYLAAVTYIMANSSPQKITSEKDVEDLTQQIVNKVSTFSVTSPDTSYFNEMADRGQKFLDQMKEVEVPQNFLESHVKGLQMATYAVSLKDQAGVNPDDPLGSIVNLSKVRNLTSLGIQFASDIDGQLKDLGISEIPFNL